MEMKKIEVPVCYQTKKALDCGEPCDIYEQCVESSVSLGLQGKLPD